MHAAVIIGATVAAGFVRQAEDRIRYQTGIAADIPLLGAHRLAVLIPSRSPLLRRGAGAGWTRHNAAQCSS